MAINEAQLVKDFQDRFTEVTGVDNKKAIMELANLDAEIYTWYVDYKTANSLYNEMPEYLKKYVKDSAVWNEVKTQISDYSDTRKGFEVRRSKLTKNYRFEQKNLDKEIELSQKDMHPIFKIHKFTFVDLPRKEKIKIALINVDTKITSKTIRDEKKEAVLFNFKLEVLKVWEKNGDWKALLK
jgi:hypothetical protein